MMRFFPEIWNLTLQDEGQVGGRFSLHSWKKGIEREKMDDAPKVAGFPIQLHSRQNGFCCVCVQDRIRVETWVGDG